MSRIECLPRGVCSWGFLLRGEGHEILIESNWRNERGQIVIDGDSHEVAKHGFASGFWTLEKECAQILRAKKRSAFTRTFDIHSEAGTTTLEAVSAFKRTMVAKGPSVDFTIGTAHAFTRRATIEGTWSDFALVAFAFWLTVITWRRAAGNNAGAP